MLEDHTIPNHIHRFTSLPPKLGIARAIEFIKSKARCEFIMSFRMGVG
ncbi:MAG: hypothetical protein GY732_20890 [Gammaproteobacteria bacterium]|nr:hypothetical protein [Gammaproteobacteria bacterium]